MLNKIASKYLEKKAFFSLFDDQDPYDLDKIYQELDKEIPKNAITDDDGVWYSDEFFEEPAPKQTVKNLKGYNHKQLVKRINSKLLPLLMQEYKAQIPEHIKTLKLLGIKRQLSDSKSMIPYEYRLVVGSDDDKDWTFNNSSGHMLILYPEDLSKIYLE